MTDRCSNAANETRFECKAHNRSEFYGYATKEFFFLWTGTLSLNFRDEEEKNEELFKHLEVLEFIV
jgi:hypothetical protein